MEINTIIGPDINLKNFQLVNLLSGFSGGEHFGKKV